MCIYCVYTINLIQCLIYEISNQVCSTSIICRKLNSNLEKQAKPSAIENNQKYLTLENTMVISKNFTFSFKRMLKYLMIIFCPFIFTKKQVYTTKIYTKTSKEM